MQIVLLQLLLHSSNVAQSGSSRHQCSNTMQHGGIYRCCWAQLLHDSWTDCINFSERFCRFLSIWHTNISQSTTAHHGLQVSCHLLLGCMAPDFEAKGSSSTKESPLLADVVAAHHKQCFALLSMSLAHDLHQGSYRIVLHSPPPLLLMLIMTMGVRIATNPACAV